MSKLLYSTKNRSGILESKAIWASACPPFEGARVDDGCPHRSGMRACVSLSSWTGDRTESGTCSSPAPGPRPGPPPPPQPGSGCGRGPCGAAVTLHPHGWALPSLRPTEGTVTNRRSFPQAFLSLESSLKRRLAELLSSDWVTRPVVAGIGQETFFPLGSSVVFRVSPRTWGKRLRIELPGGRDDELQWQHASGDVVYPAATLFHVLSYIRAPVLG